MLTDDNVDQDEIAKFEKLASRWWDPNSEFKPLHDINPLRAGWIDQHASGQRINPFWTSAAGEACSARHWRTGGLPSPESTWARRHCPWRACTSWRAASR